MASKVIEEIMKKKSGEKLGKTMKNNKIQEFEVFCKQQKISNLLTIGDDEKIIREEKPRRNIYLMDKKF